MSSIEPFTPEGIDPNSSYLATCINRVNLNYKSAIASLQSGDPTLRTDLNALTLKVNRGGYITINVKDYGATGDGIFDDTLSIQTAMGAVPADYGIIYFPKGIYKISGVIGIQNKNFLIIKSDNAVINQTHNDAGLYVNNCRYTRTEGSISIYTTTTGLTNNYGLFLTNNSMSNFSNIYVRGDFFTGVYLGINSAFNGSGTSINVFVDGCRRGIYMTGEYYELKNCHCYNNTYGAYLVGGNHGIIGGLYCYNTYGIYITGDEYANPDHGRIIGCTINHNAICGIWMKRLFLSESITGNQIWANKGSAGGLTGAISASARPYRYGLYMEGCTGVSVVGNQFMSNEVNLGYDGLCCSVISGNNFFGDGGRVAGYGLTEFHIGEFGENNRFYSGHISFNNITNNIFESPLGTGSTVSTRNFINYLTTYTNSTNNIIRGNIGTSTSSARTLSTYMYIGGSTFPAGQTYNIVDRENYMIEKATVFASDTSTNPADQSTNIFISPYLFGLSFNIYISYTPIEGRCVWVRVRTSSGNSPTIDPSAYGCTYSTTYKAFKFTTTPRFKFMPFNETPVSWIIYGY
jgi:hypothetical protein